MPSPGELRLRKSNNRHEKDHHNFCPAGALLCTYDNIYCTRTFRQRYNLNNAFGSVPVLQPEEDPNLLFGVMLTTDFPQVGVIRFKLAAIVERFADGWEAVGIAAPANPETEEHTLIPAPEVPIEKITPPADKKNPWRKKK